MPPAICLKKRKKPRAGYVRNRIAMNVRHCFLRLRTPSGFAARYGSGRV